MGKSVSKPVPTGKVIIEDKTLIKWLAQKDELVKDGRKISKEIADIEKRIEELSKQEMELTGKVEPKELIKEGNELREKINKDVKKLEKISKAIYAEKMKAIPDDMRKEHLALSDKKEKAEKERNKMALKVQKIKDRAIPKIQKYVTKENFLDEYEDLLTADLKGGKVVVEKFSHLDDWKRQWAAKHSTIEK